MSANHIPAPEKKLYDWASILLYLGIVLFGWLNIYAACYDEAHASVFDFSRQHGKQILWMASAFLIAVCILLIHPRVFSNGSYIIYGIVLLLLVATLFIGTVTNGGQSWIDFGAFKFQPSEFAKFATALALSKYISAIDIDLTLLRTRATLALMVLVPAGLILLQHDTGSALVFLAFLLPFFREGLSHYILLIGLLAIILFVSALLINKYLLMGILLAICLFYLFVWLSKRTSRNYWHTAAFFIVCCLFTLSVEFTFEHVLEATTSTKPRLPSALAASSAKDSSTAPSPKPTSSPNKKPTSSSAPSAKNGASSAVSSSLPPTSCCSSGSSPWPSDNALPSHAFTATALPPYSSSTSPSTSAWSSDLCPSSAYRCHFSATAAPPSSPSPYSSSYSSAKMPTATP